MADRPKKILVIDDEEDIRTLLEIRLSRAGFDTVVAAEGLDGLRWFYSDRPDLVILDISMPVMDGWQVLERLREVSSVPVLMLTSAAQEQDKVRGLRGGADDYITKPFAGEELVARVVAALRRVGTTPQDDVSSMYADPEVTIDFTGHEVVVRGDKVELSATEFRLLGALTKHANQIMSQNQLLDQVWGQDYSESLDVVRVYIGYLRRKIELDPGKPKLIETVRGFGYRYRKPIG